MSTNPFDDEDYPSSSSRRRRPPTTNIHNTSTTNNHSSSSSKPEKQPIYSARGVEWPLPPSFDAGSYRKYRRISKSLGISLGISGCGLKLPEVDLAVNTIGGNSIGSGGEGGGGVGYGGLSGLMGRVLGGASSGVVGVGLSSEFFISYLIILYLYWLFVFDIGCCTMYLLHDLV